GAVGSYQNLKWLSVIFVFSAMTPQFIYYLTTASVDGMIMAFALLIFIVFMSNIGLQLHKDAINTLALNYELVVSNEKLEQLTRTDVLTGLNNRRSLFEKGGIILTSAQRYGNSLSVVMLDIDNFKSINDTYGHATGDEVLKAVASTLSQGVRDSDFAGRVGGEEFAVILQETNLTSAQGLIERLRAAVELTNIHIESQDISVTASFGIAQFEADNDDFDKLLSRADVALYQAKEGGRNQVIINEESST
ncbi:MAG: GGDEF domain-containing protein, partial [Gammaproteobacteria bacterium]|nr:GGDEF domain-containing protein [Gammaproteobacteria bacterium]